MVSRVDASLAQSTRTYFTPRVQKPDSFRIPSSTILPVKVPIHLSILARSGQARGKRFRVHDVGLLRKQCRIQASSRAVKGPFGHAYFR